MSKIKYKYTRIILILKVWLVQSFRTERNILIRNTFNKYFIIVSFGANNVLIPEENRSTVIIIIIVYFENNLMITHKACLYTYYILIICTNYYRYSITFTSINTFYRMMNII